MKRCSYSSPNAAFPLSRNPECKIRFKGQRLQKDHEAFLVHSAIEVELKAVRTLLPGEDQLSNELKGTPRLIGYFLNFGSAPRRQWYRRVKSEHPIISAP